MIKTLELVNFRNHERLKLNFNKPFVYIYGENGTGKTSILEAIHYLSTTKSFRTSEDKELVKLGEPFSKISLRNEINAFEVVLSKTGKRVFVDNLEKRKISEYIGGFNAVVFALEDLELVKGTPSDRRQFMDLEFSRIDKEYLGLLNEYKKILKQRNSLLKKIHVSEDLTMLNILGESLYEVGIKIIKKRAEYLSDLNKRLIDVYKEFSDHKIELKYLPNVSESEFYDWVTKKQEIDIMYQTTSAGIHKDDFILKLNGNDSRGYGSNGEQRLIVISLKMALLSKIQEIKNKEIVLLLDDVLSELDGLKQELILSKIPRDNMIIITSASPCKIAENIEIIMLKNGMGE